ncbi:MAG: addiction module protein, partial [Cyclobacteriaceae bacterium]|nr:addiction module protein [Cyclobacteriaceae bacterium]
FIPIQEWNNLKSKLGDIDQANTDIPDWHREIVRKRMELYKNGTDQAMDFDTAINDIENEL